MLNGIGQIGCSPNALAQNSPDGTTCVAKINSANQIFNNQLRSLVDTFNRELTDAKFIYINNYGIFQSLISSPRSYGTYILCFFTLPILAAGFLKKLGLMCLIELCRFHCDKCRVLWSGKEQWPNYLSSWSKTLSK